MTLATRSKLLNSKASGKTWYLTKSFTRYRILKICYKFVFSSQPVWLPALC